MFAFSAVHREAHAGDAARVISEVDAGLAALLRRDVLDAVDIDVVFDAPTRDWASGRSAPTVNAFLYDIREDTRRRQHGEITARNGNGECVRRRPPRVFTLSYLVTVWTQRPADEHRLLGAVLSCLLRYEALPEDLLADEVTSLGLPVTMSVALPPGDDRSFADVWTALGGQLKPSLDLVICAPVAVGLPAPLMPLVSEPLRVSLHDTGGTG
ncbi:MAG: DUF4255 domain-containing protein [Sciscionella sp.]